MGASQNYSVNLNINANTGAAKTQLQSLQQQLQQIASIKIDADTGTLTQDIQAASQAAMQLSAHLATATNQKTGNLDFTKFYSSIQKSGSSLEEYGAALQKMGPAGQKAFVNLADSISKSEIPLRRASKLMDGMWVNLKKTVGWQISSRMVNSFVGSMQQAVGYAKDLNSSLTDIRIVTGSSAEQMASFAKEANNAAKKLSTTTTDYTKASLIYYQQGLSDAEVKARTEATIKMANATGTSASKVSDQMTAVWNNFYDGSKSLEYYQDVMTALGAATASSTDEISEGVNKFAATAKTVGLSYEYATAGLATVTAKTRESADVVGNAFKTLFARIQGLSLGETLDDGTDLNKYSLALAKVGVAVKDSSGELRAMDDILDDLGETWGTLSTAQQTALAQTVGGVRQYSQLMALMNNWDYFKENVQVAKSSEGALEQQAAIYAKSWQAASDRVRASWEGLWDTLIDSDGFIGALDMLSGFVDMLTGMSEGLGGVTGLLGTFSGVLLKTFNSQIASNISDVAYSVKMLFPSQQQKVVDERNNWIKSVQDTLHTDKFEIGHENEVAALSQGLQGQINNSLAYSKYGSGMTQEQQMMYNMMQNNRQGIYDDYVTAGKRLDAAKMQQSEFVAKTFNSSLSRSFLDESLGDVGPEYIAEQEALIEQQKENIKQVVERVKSQGYEQALLKDGSRINKNYRSILGTEINEIDSYQANIDQYEANIASARRMASTNIYDRTNKFGDLASLTSKYEKAISDSEAVMASAKAALGDKFGQSSDQLNETQQKQMNQYNRANWAKEVNSQYLTQLQEQAAGPNTFNQALKFQARSVDNLKTNWAKIANMTDDTQKGQAFIEALTEFTHTASNNMGATDFMKKMQDIATDLQSDDIVTRERAQGSLNALFTDDTNKSAFSAFLISSGNVVAENVFDYLKNKSDFQKLFMSDYNGDEQAAKKAFVQEATTSFGNVSAAQRSFLQQQSLLNNADASQQEEMRRRQQEQSYQQKMQGGISLAQGSLQAVTSGTQFINTLESLTNGTASFTSAITGLLGAFTNGAMGVNAVAQGLNALGNVGLGTGTKIGIAIAALTAAISLGTKIYDKWTVSESEHQQNLIDSSNELNNSVSITQERIETVERQNKEYLDGVKKIESLSQDPTTLAQDIFESNQKALNLISEYGLTSDQYTTSANGVIKIDENVLKGIETSAENANQVSQYANILGQAWIDKEQAQDNKPGLDSEGQSKINALMNNFTDQDLAKYINEYMENNSISDPFSFTDAQIFELVHSEGYQEAVSKTIQKLSSGELGLYDQLYVDTIDALTEYSNNENVIKSINAENHWDAAVNTVTGKIMQDSGYDSTVTEGYQAKSKILAAQVEAAMSEANQFLKPDSTAELTEDQKEEAAALIESQYGLSNIKITGVDDEGKIKYQQGDDESTADTVDRNTLNAWHAAAEIVEDSANLTAAANQQYNTLYGKFGDAAEAAANLGEFGTAAGASAASLMALNTEDNKQQQITNSQNVTKTVADLLADSGAQAQIDTISEVSKTLGLGDMDGVLNKTSVETLTTLGKLMEPGDNAKGLSDLFNGIIEATGDEDPEKAAALLTTLANMDFSGNDYLNANNLLNTLQELGYSVDEGNLPTIYNWIAAIVGLGAGEDLASSANKITENRNVLNKVTPGGTVDAATKQAAAKAGLTDNWVKTGDDEYTYVGTQENIDTAKSNANKAFTQTQKDIDAAQGKYQGLKSKGYLKGISKSYSSTEDLLTALGVTGNDDNGAILLKTEEQLAAARAIAKALGMGNGNDAYNFLDALLNGDTTVLDKFNKFMTDGSITPQAQDAQVEEHLAGIESAKDMMQAIEDGTAGVVDENGIITDKALNRLKSFPETSARATKAYTALTEAKNHLHEIEAQANADKIVTSEEEQAIKNATEVYAEAEAWAMLQTEIDAVAAARGLDAEAVAFHAEQLQQTLSKEDQTTLGSKNIASMAADLAEQQNAVTNLNAAWKTLSKTLSKDELTQDKGQALKELGGYLDGLTNSTTFATKSFDTLNKGYKKFLSDGGDMNKILKGNRQEITKLARSMSEITDEQFEWAKAQRTTSKEGNNVDKTANNYQEALDIIDQGMSSLKDSYDGGVLSADDITGGEATLNSIKQAWLDIYNSCRAGGMDVASAMDEAAAQTGLEGYVTEGAASNSVTNEGDSGTAVGVQYVEEDCHGFISHIPTIVTENVPGSTTSSPTIDNLELVKKGDAPKGTPASGGGGGGGSKPKKVANKRKSQTVKRYKRNDYKKSTNDFSKKTEENKKDYLYGEQKIAQLEKINKLTEKEAHLNADRIKEARAYLEEDRNNLQKYLQKYGYDMKLEADGYLANYEEVWTDIYNQIAALYSDNLLDESESELEEQLKVMQEELEGALEDYEDSLQELYDTIEAYEDSLYEMYDNQVEQIEHRIEFKTELDTDQLDYMDFILEAIGDNAERAVDAIDAMGQKTSTLLDGIDTYNDAIASAYEISDSPLQTLITNGVEGLLTEKQVELLRDSKDGLIDYMTQLLELRESVMEKLTDAFDVWNEKMQSSLTTIEHYGSVLEYFKNIVDVVGKDVFGLSDKFMDNLEQSAIDQANDNLEATRANYLGLLEEYEYANEQLALARERNDESSITQWEETVRTVKEEMESAEDTMMSALESALTLIAEQFETTMQRAVDAFNDAIYAHGGLEGLSSDYSLIRENADLMAEDYEKIYNLSKLNRDITKTLDDTKIIAGKSRLISLQKEINELQKSNVELSQYDLEYLQAKYDLRLAEIELENAQNAKSQVRLSKDSEGNWSYVYTQSTDAVEEAEQKYEDALYAMQELSQDYLEEMSSKMVDTSSAMMDEISALRIQDFDSYEDYQAEVKAIQDKYAESLRLQENELNKAISNSSELYQKDWQAYSQYTGYKISAASDWVDTFKESTLGGLLDADTLMSNFGDTILGLADELNKKLSAAGANYFTNVESAMNKYGTSIDGFKNTVTTATGEIATKSKDATKEVQDMAKEMTSSFKEVADSVTGWQTDFSLKIDDLLEEVKTMIESINEAIKKSAELTTDNVNYDLIGAADAIDLINATGKFGTWTTGEDGYGIQRNGEDKTFVEYLGTLVADMDAAMKLYYDTSSKSNDKEKYKKQLEDAILLYNEFKSIVDRLYDVSDTNMPKSKYGDKATSMDTGGYTGEWGSSGKFAMLHEKELVLNKGDTENFLEAIGISRDLVNSVIELNARSSGMGLGALMATGAEGTNQQVLEQYVNITADFPNATEHTEIAEALSDLTNLASQYANR